MIPWINQVPGVMGQTTHFCWEHRDNSRNSDVGCCHHSVFWTQEMGAREGPGLPVNYPFFVATLLNWYGEHGCKVHPSARTQVLLKRSQPRLAPCTAWPES